MKISSSNAPIGYRPVIEGSAVVLVKGDINLREMLRLRKCLQDYTAAGHLHFVLSLAGVDHVNYLSLGILLEQLIAVRKIKGDIRLSGLQPHVRRIFSVCGCDRHFEIYATIEEALESYTSEWAGVEERQMA